MLTLLLPALALAKPTPLECPEGQAQLHRKATVCCWEGQAWDKRAKQCTGEPTCPDGTVAEEDADVAGTWTCVPELAPSGGILGALNEPGALGGVIGSAGLDRELAAGVADGMASREGPAPPPSASGDGLLLGDGIRFGGSPIILGALDKVFVEAGLIGADKALDACTTQLAAAGWSDTGKVVVKFTVGTDGEVSAASVKSSALDDAETAACLATVIGDLAFPAPKGGGIAIISYPFFVGPTG